MATDAIACEVVERLHAMGRGKSGTDPATDRAVEAHLASCAHCRRDSAAALNLRGLFPAAEDAGAEATRASDAMFVNSVMARVRAEPAPAARVLTRIRWTRFAAMWAMAFVVGAAFASIVPERASIENEPSRMQVASDHGDDWFAVRMPGVPAGSDEFGFLRERQAGGEGIAETESGVRGREAKDPLPVYSGRVRGDEGVSF